MAPISGGPRPLTAWTAARAVWPALALLPVLASTAATAAAQPLRPGVRATAASDPGDRVVREATSLVANRLASLPVVQAVDPRDVGVSLPSINTPAFRIHVGRQVDPVIFVNSSSDLYRRAREGDRCALKSLAAVLVHEMAHSATRDDRVASRLELEVLDWLIRQPSTGIGEQTCLMERQAEIRVYAGLKPPSP
jgi:hypothetical protein